MCNRKKSFDASNKTAGKKICRRLRRKYQNNFRKKNFQNLKEALKDRLSVIRVSWQLHYLTIEFICGTTIIIYGNLKDAARILRSRLFYPSCSVTLVSLYFFKEISKDEEGNSLVFPDKPRKNCKIWEEKTEKLVEKLLEKDEKDMEWLTQYLLGGQYMQDAKRLSR